METTTRKGSTAHWSVEICKLRLALNGHAKPKEPSCTSRARGVNPDALRSIIDGLEKDLNFTMACEHLHGRDKSLPDISNLTQAKLQFGWLATIPNR